jgi:hypothetical protein
MNDRDPPDRESGRHVSVALAAIVALCTVVAVRADDARKIVEEAQRRSQASSQRYEGLLQVFDTKGKISDKRWTYERLGSHCQSKTIVRFIRRRK